MKQGLGLNSLVRMELYIETLTGTAFELRVSPFETVMSVKAKIQRLEGIPISHQHLIWQSIELEDDYCLHDYQIHNGATLKLVLALRGGPINTRRIPVEDTALREMAEYMEANKDEILDKLPDNRNVTLLVFREGDQLNFFRVVDRGDGTLTPLSETLSTSVYNLNEEEEEEEVHTKEKVEENDKMKEKLDQLRINMEKMSLTRKKRPKPPSSGRTSHSGTHLRLRHLSSGGHSFSNTFNKNACLPPVGQTFPSASTTTLTTSSAVAASSAAAAFSTYSAAAEKLAEAAAAAAGGEGRDKSSSAPSLLLTTVNARHPSPSTEDATGEAGDLSQTSELPRPKSDLLECKTGSPVAFSRKDLHTLASTSESLLTHKNSMGDGGLLETLGEVLKRSPLTARKDMTVSGLRADGFSRPTTSSRFPGVDRRKEIALENLTTGEARTMSGILRQASIEKLGTSHMGTIVSSASKSRLSNYCIQEAHIPTPEGRIMSGTTRLRMSASREGRIMTSSHRLPPVKAKKKASKRCYVCAKKTGLATSYQCRCGNNFCASHRYAESHDCTFDYKSEGRKLLEQNNPVVTAPKLPKI
ncbi:hypothetical protein C0Q70_01141 [Pomacea canaliculata]|uniref:AN1-type domain-containing protein n=3 Tax=Pomacea canaliculata TaxID=400727 RepID=A0A2T7PYM1_POMCA|nr:hypothetical protein C0Q70_01141 [Pomacea canaliculata]